MNYRAEIDALMNRRPDNRLDADPYSVQEMGWLYDCLRLAARIHAEPHGDECQIGWHYQGGQHPPLPGACTCGKDKALAEVLS